MVRMFERVGLQKNLGKTKAMICKPWFIWGQHGVEAYKRRATGEGPNFREKKVTGIICKVCGGIMDASSMRHHMERSHGRVLPQVRGVDTEGGGLEVYKVSFLQIPKLVECLVEGCLSRKKTREG